MFNNIQSLDEETQDLIMDRLEGYSNNFSFEHWKDQHQRYREVSDKINEAYNNAIEHINKK